MRISEDKLTYLADQITRTLRLEQALALKDAPREEVLRQVTLALRKDSEREAAIEQKITQKISSIKRRIEEGSPEWNTLRRQYYEEELDKLHAIKKAW